GRELPRPGCRSCTYHWYGGIRRIDYRHGDPNRFGAHWAAVGPGRRHACQLLVYGAARLSAARSPVAYFRCRALAACNGDGMDTQHGPVSLPIYTDFDSPAS